VDCMGLVEAWSAWDRWATKFSAGKARGARSGAAVSARLVETEIEYARELGMKPTELHTQIAERRRAGLSVEEAVAQVTGHAAGPRSEPLPGR
jgi:hypothetical protein